VTSGPDNARFTALMRDAQAGDTRAYGALLRELAPVLRRVIGRRRTFVDDADVEDLVQDVLLSLHRVRATYDPARAFLPWLLAIVRNRMADSARRHHRVAAREVSLEELTVTFSHPEANTDAGDEVDTHELRQAIADLPAGQRQAVTMLKLEEMSLEEVSARTGLSVGALKVATHRALATLRRKMTGA
jgi:RNA polymerase sigma-70 factor (ECF subfamily)